MSEHRATIAWQRNGPNFLKGHFSREHTWAFDGGVTVLASPSPTVIPKPWSNPEGVDPEDVSINLMLTKTRLRPEWIRDFLARPKQIAGAQTRMPTVFYSVDGEPKVEQPKEDIDDITTYLMGMTEPPEVTLKAEAETKKAEEKQQPTDWSNVQY